MAGRIEGRVWKYGDHVDTDVIFPGKYTYTLQEAEAWAAHALEDLDPSFAGGVRPGDVILAGRNWGCGSSREQAVGCLKTAGVGAVIAVSFARIYFRNSINTGLPAIVCPDAYELISAGERITVDLSTSVILTATHEIPFPPLSASVLEILKHGGLIPYLRHSLESA